MASIVKGTERYFNRYEAAYNRLKGTNQFFEDSDWQYLQDMGNMDNINMYITGSEKLQKEGYTAEQIFGTGPNNSNTRFMSIITEAFLKDDNTVKTHFVPWSPDEVTKLKEEAAAYEEQYKADARDRIRTGEKMYEYDNKALNTLNLGGKEEELTEYEYMKRLIQNEQLTIDNEHWNQFTKETKDINFWTKLGGGALSILANLAIGADIALSFTAATFVHGGSYLFVDIWDDIANGNTKNLDYRLRMIDEQSKGTLTNAEIAGRSFQDVMIDFESDYTNFRDEYGNLTTAGQIFVNAARTAGEMMAASFIGGGLARQLGAVSPTYAFAADGTFKMVGFSSKTAKLGKFSFDLARIVGTTTYYAPMAARSMAANYVELSAADPSIHTGTIVAHSITATAAEIAIEIGLGKLLGDTGLNKWLLGGGKPNPKIVKNFAGYLGTYAKDILQEGTEELLQEFSNIAIDNAFGKAVNENFGQLSELTFQTAANAFIIGALVSAGHAGVNVVSDIVGASPLTIADGEGNTTKLSRLQSVVYGYNLKTYGQSVKDASAEMADALDRMYKALPVSEQIVYLTEELSEAEDELKRYEAVSEIGTKTGLSDETVSKIAGIEIDEETESAEPKDSSKIGQYRAELRKVKKANLEQNVKRIKSELARLKKESSKEQNAIKKGVKQGDKKSRKTAKELRAVKQDFVDAFSVMVASSRMIQAFSSEIGAEQVAKAEELLTAMTKKIKAEDGGSKLDPEYIAKSLEEMTSTLRLKGIHISKKDIEKLKKSGNTTILELYNIDDFGKKKEESKPTFDENSSGYEKEHEEIEKVLNGSDLKNVAVTEDGESAVELEDGETIVVPQAEVKAGATEIFKDLAEQKLVESLMNYEFKGNPISRVIKIFKDIYGEDKTDEEAVYALCFDKTFYATVLDGDTERGISIADSDMFQFLVALEKMLDSIVPNNVKTEIYKTRIESVRNDMVTALFEYVKLQPHADYRLDVFNSTQKIELIKLYEAGEFANRIVSGKYTPDDWKLLMAKVDAINLSTEKKNQLKEAFKSNRPTVIKAALAAIDEQYRIMFDGSHNGSIYMPSNHLVNKTFNQFLYRQGLEISDLLTITSNDAEVLKQYGEPSEKNILKLRSKQLQQFSNGKYGLRIMPKSDRQVDPSDSYFNVGNFTVRIVSLKSNIDSRNRNQFESDVVYALNRSDVAYRSGRNTTLVNDILASDVVKDYYVIDDVITNPSLLSNEIQSKIKEKFGDLNDENVFRFLKQYFLQKTGNVSISLTQDGEVVFVDLKDSTKMINGEKAKTIKYGTTKLSEVVNPDYQIPFFNNVTIAKSDKGTYIINEGRAGRDKYVLYLDNQGGTLRDLTTSLAHETQHAIQIANKLNYGNDGEILGRLYKADQERVIKEVKEHLPNLFEGVDESEHEGIVNDFLYYASGEAEAYGSAFNEVVDFYPVVVKINEDRTSTVTLPWGTVIKTIKSNQRASKRYDVQQRLDSQNERMLSLEDRITDLADGADDYVNTNDGTYVINPFNGEKTDIPEELQGKKLYYYMLDDGVNLTEEDRSVARNLKDRIKSIVAKCIKNDVLPDWSNPDFFTLFVEEFHDYLKFDVRVNSSEVYKVYNKIIDVIQQTLYPDTFYSQMMKAIEGMKDGKHGAQSVIPYLKDQKRGVKDEEIEWSGLEAFLEGKKSVTKEELLEFVTGSMLQIEEEILEGDQARWDQHSIINGLGGSNHRNLLFKLPDSTYGNQNMHIHWGGEKSGILAHARISDLYKNGEKILFVDEIQSDWHNQGHKKGYRHNDEESRKITERRDETRRVRDEFISELASYLEATNRPAPELQAKRYVNFGLSNEERKIETFRKFCENVGLSEDFKRRIEDYRPEYQKALDDWHKLDDLTLDAPFKDTYQEFVMKRLVRMAAQEGYDRIAWTDKDMQLDRWNPRRETYREMGEPYVSEVKNPDAVAFEEGYRTEYDIQIPSFMKKAYKKFGVKVEKGSLQGDNITFDFNKRDDGTIKCVAINRTTGEVTTSIVNSEEARVAFVEMTRENLKSEQMWSMLITAEMKKSVLREGQPLYNKAREIDWDVDEKLAAKMPEDATLEDVKTVFNELNENSELKILFEKVYTVCEKLVPEGLTISFNNTHRSFSTPDSYGRYASGHYQGNRINYFKSYIASQNVDPQFRASVLLHELIHAAVSQHLMVLESGISIGHFIDPLTGRIHKMPKKLYTEIKPDSSWSDGMKGALALAQIFEQIYLDSLMDRDTEIYGTINVHEFVAELANPEFRMYLKKKTLWQRIIDAIKRIFGMAETNALSAADMALNKVLDSYDSYQPYVMPDFLSKYMTSESNSGGKARMKAASRRVPIKSTKGSNLEAFGGQQLSPELKGFIEDARYTPDGGINKGLWLKIKDGTLKRTDIFDYFYSTPGTNRRDKETFDLINKHYFKNRHIKSFKELDQRVTLLPQYYAIMKIMRGHKFDKDLAKINDPNLFDVFKQLVNDNKVDARRFNQYVLEFEESVEYDTKAVRRLWMRKFDGSVRSIGTVANIAFQLQNEEYMNSTTKINTTSIDATKEGKDGDELKLSEIIEDKEVDETLSADDQFYMRLYTQGDEAYDDASEALDVLSAFADNPEALRAHVLTLLKDKADDPSFEAGMKRLALLLETTGKKTDIDTDVEAAIIRASNRMSKRTPRNMVQNIKHHEADINAMIRSKTIKSEGRKQFLRDTKGVFDENFNLIKDTYKSANGRYLEESILLKLEKTLKDLKQAIKDGVYSKQGVDFHKESEAFMDEVRKTLKEMSKGKPVEFKLSNNEVRVNSSKPMPEAIRKIINTELDKSAPTRVQMLTKDNEIHAKIMMSKFIKGNIDFLQNLDQGEVDEIIDYFLTTEMLPSTNEGIIYVSVKQFMLGYLLKANDEGGKPFSLTEKQINDVENHLRTMVSVASTIVVNWREILRSYNLRKEETKASMRFYDLNLSHETQDLVVKAVISGDVTAMRNAKDQAFEELKKKYHNRKTTIWEKMINLQRVMMLSSPGTWVRNIASNLLIGGVKSKEGKVIIPGLNEITELMALLPQTKASKRLAAKDLAEHRTGSRRVYTQYKIVGTKVTTDVQSFIKKDLLDNGYLNLITNGLMKYSTGSLRSTGLTGVDKVVGLIKSAVENQLFDNTNFAQLIISKVMSDSWAVNRSMIRFLGKMLTEDNVDVSKGMTENILPYIADAYVMAAQDFMHRPNFFNKLEYWAKNHARHTIGDNWAGAAFFLYKQIIPFGAAGWNWFVDKLDYTPLGLGKGIIDLIRLETTVDRMITAQSKGVQVRSQRFAEYLAKRRIGKGIIGTVALIAGILLVAAGKAGVDDEDDKYKIWVGSGPDRIYLDLSNLHGTNSLTVGMAIADSFIDARNGEFNIDKFNKVIADVLDEMLNDFVLTDVYNQFRHYDSLGEAAVDTPIQVVDMFMPKFLGTISSAFRKYRIKYSSGFKGSLERLAGSFFAPLAEGLGAEYWINPYTGKPEAVNKFHWMTIFNKFSPVKVNQYEIGESEKIAIELGISSSMLTGRYTINDKKVNLDSVELNELNIYYGERNAKELKDFTNGKTKYRVETVNGDYKLLSYRTMTDIQKKAVIERIMSNNSRFAKIYILTKDGKYKYYASDSEYEELRKAGIVKNVYRKTKKLEGFVNN